MIPFAMQGGGAVKQSQVSSSVRDSQWGSDSAKDSHEQSAGQIGSNTLSQCGCCALNSSSSTDSAAQPHLGSTIRLRLHRSSIVADDWQLQVSFSVRDSQFGSDSAKDAQEHAATVGQIASNCFSQCGCSALKSSSSSHSTAQPQGGSLMPFALHGGFS
jgi:hypothetical protein